MESEYPNLDQDVEACDWICAKIRARDDYAQNFYAALCNNEFQRNKVWPILKNQTWTAPGGMQVVLWPMCVTKATTLIGIVREFAAKLDKATTDT
jgi:hypothetical protein